MLREMYKKIKKLHREVITIDTKLKLKIGLLNEKIDFFNIHFYKPGDIVETLNNDEDAEWLANNYMVGLRIKADKKWKYIVFCAFSGDEKIGFVNTIERFVEKVYIPCPIRNDIKDRLINFHSDFKDTIVYEYEKYEDSFYEIEKLHIQLKELYEELIKTIKEAENYSSDINSCLNFFDFLFEISTTSNELEISIKIELKTDKLWETSIIVSYMDIESAILYLKIFDNDNWKMNLIRRNITQTNVLPIHKTGDNLIDNIIDVVQTTEKDNTIKKDKVVFLDKYMKSIRKEVKVIRGSL